MVVVVVPTVVVCSFIDVTLSFNYGGVNSDAYFIRNITPTAEHHAVDLRIAF